MNLATEEVVATLDLVGVEETDAAIARAVAVGPAWRAVAPADRGMLLRRFADAVEAQHRGTRATRGDQRRPHDRQRPLGGRNVVGVSRYYAAAPERLFGRQIPVAGGLDVTFKGTARRGLGHRAVELSDADCRLGLRPGARRGKHGGPRRPS